MIKKTFASLPVAAFLFAGIAVPLNAQTPAATAQIPGTQEETGGIPLLRKQYIDFDKIPDNAVYCGDTTIGHDFEFELGEAPDKNLVWRVVSYDPANCRVEVDHDDDGVWPLKKHKAEIEVKVMYRCKTSLLFQCGKKKITLILNCL